MVLPIVGLKIMTDKPPFKQIIEKPISMPGSVYDEFETLHPIVEEIVSLKHGDEYQEYIKYTRVGIIGAAYKPLSRS